MPQIPDGRVFTYTEWTLYVTKENVQKIIDNFQNISIDAQEFSLIFNTHFKRLIYKGLK